MCCLVTIDVASCGVATRMPCRVLCRALAHTGPQPLHAGAPARDCHPRHLGRGPSVLPVPGALGGCKGEGSPVGVGHVHGWLDNTWQRVVDYRNDAQGRVSAWGKQSVLPSTCRRCPIIHQKSQDREFIVSIHGLGAWGLHPGPHLMPHIPSLHSLFLLRHSHLPPFMYAPSLCVPPYPCAAGLLLPGRLRAGQQLRLQRLVRHVSPAYASGSCAPWHVSR